MRSYYLDCIAVMLVGNFLIGLGIWAWVRWERVGRWLVISGMTTIVAVGAIAGVYGPGGEC